MSRASRARRNASNDGDLSRWQTKGEAYREGLHAAYTAASSKVPQSQRWLFGGHTTPTYAYNGKIVDGRVVPIRPGKPKKQAMPDPERGGATCDIMRHHRSVNTGQHHGAAEKKDRVPDRPATEWKQSGYVKIVQR